MAQGLNKSVETWLISQPFDWSACGQHGQDQKLFHTRVLNNTLQLSGVKHTFCRFFFPPRNSFTWPATESWPTFYFLPNEFLAMQARPCKAKFGAPVNNTVPITAVKQITGRVTGKIQDKEEAEENKRGGKAEKQEQNQGKAVKGVNNNITLYFPVSFSTWKVKKSVVLIWVWRLKTINVCGPRHEARKCRFPLHFQSCVIRKYFLFLSHKTLTLKNKQRHRPTKTIYLQSDSSKLKFCMTVKAGRTWYNKSQK